MVNRRMESIDRLLIGVAGLLVGLHGAILGVSACGWIWGWFQMLALTSLVDWCFMAQAHIQHTFGPDMVHLLCGLTTTSIRASRYSNRGKGITIVLLIPSSRLATEVANEASIS